MTDTETLRSLLERCKAATGPDRELDADIAVALGHKITWRTSVGTMEPYPDIHWQAPHYRAGLREPCPCWSASIDAVVALIEIKLPGWDMELRRSSYGSFCSLMPENVNESDKEEHCYADSNVFMPTLPLAMLCALLSALIAKADRTDTDV
jgi:hypothetical protein